jgi:hypothetical protein
MNPIIKRDHSIFIRPVTLEKASSVNPKKLPTYSSILKNLMIPGIVKSDLSIIFEIVSINISEIGVKLKWMAKA